MALNDAVPSSATDVFKRNIEDTDRLLNTTDDVVNRVGTTLESFPNATGRVSDAADAAQIAIQADVDNVDASRISAQSAITSDSDSVEASRIAAELEIANDVSQVNDSEIAAQASIQSDVDSVDATRILAEQAIQDDVDAAKAAAIANYQQWNSRGNWASATAYLVGDIWQNTATSTWYLVLNNYTSGAAVNDDITGPNVTVLQGAGIQSFEGLSEAIAKITANPELFSDNSSVSISSNKTKAECVSAGVDFPDGNGGDYVITTGETLVDGRVIAAGTKQLKLITQKLDLPIENVVKLREFEPTVNGQECELSGHTVKGLGGGKFYAILNDTGGVDNNGTKFMTAGGHSWNRKESGTVSIEDFGGLASPIDSTTAIESFNTESNGDTEILSKTYLFNGQNISNIANINISRQANFNNSIYDGIIRNDKGVFWLHQNHLEEYSSSAPFQQITSGNIPAPPIFEGDKQSHTNMLAYWYQDFGLEATRVNGAIYGSEAWYYWSWLRHGASGDGYEPERQSTLGYYRGDDANVLDWQCYWLNEAGVTGVIPQTRGGVGTSGADFGSIRATWANAGDINHWMYQLFNNAPNFKQLTYALWAWSGSNTNSPENQALIEGSFNELVAIYDEYKNFNFISKNGGVYPVVFVFEGETWRGAYDSFNGDTNTKAFLIAQANKFKAIGWDGFALLARNSSSTLVGDEDLEAAGVIYLDASYTQTNYTPSNNGGLVTPADYEDLANGIGTRPDGSPFPYQNVVPNLVTSLKSHSFHPSTFDRPGSTPELFELMARNAIRRSRKNGNPSILTCYNVSEWAEAGPALQPNMRDGKGYLTALRNALSSVTEDIGEPNRYIRQATTFISSASVSVSVEKGVSSIPLSISFSFTSTATPFLDDPLKYNGKRLRLSVASDSLVSGPITIQDDGTLAGSGLKLAATTLSLGRNDSVEFEYDSASGLYIQISNVINIP